MTNTQQGDHETVCDAGKGGRKEAEVETVRRRAHG